MSVMRGYSGPRYKHSPDEPAPYDTITVDKLTPIIGAEIGGVDLAQPLGNQTFEEIHRALAENLVIFFRDQHITDEQHLDFGRKFGKLHIHPAAPHEPGHPELMIIHADKDSPRANGEVLAQRCFVRRGAADGQHPVYPHLPAARRRHAVRVDVRRL